MTKTTKELIIISVAVPILLFSWTYNLKRIKSRRTMDSRQEIAVVEVVEEVNQAAEPQSLPDEINEMKASNEEIRAQIERLSLDWGRDPFSASGEAIQTKNNKGKFLGNLFLRGISFRAGVGVAIVNDFILREGNTVEGYTVVEILKRAVILEKDGKKYTLNLEK